MTVTLTLAKQHLEYEDADRDVLINQYIAASVAWVENYTSRPAPSRSVVEKFDSFGSFIQLKKSTLVSVTSLSYLDANQAVQTLTGFRVNDQRLYPPIGGWPSIAEYSQITVTYVAGFVTVPADIMSAQLLLIGHWFQNREAATERPAQSIELSVMSLCEPYRDIRV